MEVEEPVEEEPPPPVVEIEVQPKRAARKPKTPPSAPPSTPASAAPSDDSPEEEAPRPKSRAKAKARSEPKAKVEPKTPRVAKDKAAPDQPVASPEVNPMAAMVAALHQHKERANDHRRLMYQSFLAGMAQ